MSASAAPTTPRRNRRFERAAHLLAGHLKAPAERRGFAQQRLLSHWAEIVGQDLADIALPLKVTYGRGFGGTLVLLTRGAQAPMIEMQAPRIIEKVNASYGYRAISHVKVTQTAATGFAEGQIAFRPAPKAPPPEPDPARLSQALSGIDHIEDAELRARLTTLARHIVSKRST